MTRLTLAGLAAALLVVLPATAGASGVRLRGTVIAKDATAHTTTIRSTRAMHVLAVPGSLARIHVRQSVELRGTTLRLHRHGSRVLARGVTVQQTTLPTARDDDDEADDDEAVEDDEVEVEGTLTSLSPPTVAGVSCAVPAGVSLAGFEVGDVVELTCDRIGGVLTLREIESEDEAAPVGEDEDHHGGDDHGGGGDDNSGPGGGGGGHD